MLNKIKWFGLLGLILVVTGCSSAKVVQEAPMTPQTITDTVYVNREVMVAPGVDLSGVAAGRFDNGKMWTFDNPPVAYFEEAYGFAPDQAWFDKARLGALRIEGCSASLISPFGLVMTNHHCGRESVVKVSKGDENLLDNGFYATSLDEERAVEDFWAEQLIEIRDVTDQVDAALAGIEGDQARAQARGAAIEAIETALGEETGMKIEVVSLYNGGIFSAYIFRRYEDVRLVMAPELQMGYFGGDPDNFTFPRYNLDMSFFRIYEDGKPLDSEEFYFQWSTNGTQEGDAVFVVGNPGSTSRGSTISQLEYKRDHENPVILNLLRSRAARLDAFQKANPEAAAPFDMINEVFGLNNADKAYTGQQGGLEDVVLMARRRDTERMFREAIAADADLNTKHGTLLDEIAALQTQSGELTALFGAYINNPSSGLHSSIDRRAVWGMLYAGALANGAPKDALADFLGTLAEIKSYPAELEISLMEQRFIDMVHYLGEDDDAVKMVLNGHTPAEAAKMLVEGSVLGDSAAYVALLDDGFMDSDDPAILYAKATAAGFGQFRAGFGAVGAAEEELNSKIARARFDVYGTLYPPDATFSLRIADGFVKGYDYNGTHANAHTTFYGMYERYYANDTEFPWNLPARWATPPADLDLSTRMNLVSTNDIIGGNSGSPLLNAKLEIVGLVFDGNIESLPGEFIFTEEVARTVSVDSRGILEVLDTVYDADRMVLEMIKHKLVATEAEADAMN